MAEFYENGTEIVESSEFRKDPLVALMLARTRTRTTYLPEFHA